MNKEKIATGRILAEPAPGDVLFPDSQHQLCHGHPGKTCLKTLVPLDDKDQFQVPGLCTVIQETVIADLLKARGSTWSRKRRINSQLPMAMVRFGSPGFRPLAEKVTSVSVTERIR